MTRLPLFLLLVACGESTERADGGTNTDASDARDAGDAERDAGSTPTDAGFDAGEPPCTPGDRRVVECERCGMAAETCGDDRRWTRGACLGQGECEAASEEREPTEMCGERTRLCLATCEWTGWEQTTPPSDCDPGTTRRDPSDCPDGLLREQTCSATCAWEDTGTECLDACGGIPRLDPPEMAEVCVEGGLFVRGDGDPASPVHEVMVSSFYASKYVAINRTYERCIGDGGCTPVATWPSDDPARQEHPVVNVTWDQAVAFCAWDGGRRLLTDSEWEKTARGPAPREVLYPWGDEPRCAACPEHYGPAETPDLMSYLPPPFRWNELEFTASYYGAVGMTGAVRGEWVHDFYDHDYYSDPASWVDPAGPATGIQRTARFPLNVRSSIDHRWIPLRITARAGRLPDELREIFGFRCARTP